MVVHTGHSSPEPCFSHALVALSDQCFLMHGGAPFGMASHVYIFELDKQRWHRLEVDGDVNGLLLIRHCSVFLPNENAAMLCGRLLTIGGGAFCFSFGSSWSPSVEIDLAIVTEALELGGGSSGKGKSSQSQSQRLALERGMLTAKQTPKIGLKVPRQSAKKWKDAMKDLGLLHPSRVSQPEEECIVLALSDAILSEASCKSSLEHLTEAFQGIVSMTLFGKLALYVYMSSVFYYYYYLAR